MDTIDRWDRERQNRDQRRQVEDAESGRRAALCRADDIRITAQHQHEHDMATVQSAADTVDQLERENTALSEQVAELLEALEAFVASDMRRDVLLNYACALIARVKGESHG